jgi:hypothetical protein
MEGSGHTLIKVLSQHSSGVIELTHKKPRSGYPLMNWNGFGSGRSKI